MIIKYFIKVFYQRIHAIFLPHEYMLDYKKVKTNVSFVLYVWVFFGFEIAMSVFFLFKHAVVLLVNTLQPVKMAHALTCIHVHVLKVIPELIVILLLVCRILVYLLKNVQHTFGIFCLQFFQLFPFLKCYFFLFFPYFVDLCYFKHATIVLICYFVLLSS